MMFGFGKKPGASGGLIVPDSADIHLGWPLGSFTQGAPAGRPLLYDGERHLLLIGPNGSGKGTAIQAPNLLHLRDRSVIAIDPKCELTAITADYRRTVSDVIVLNPFQTLGIVGASFNPLASLDEERPTHVDDVLGVAEALVTVEQKDPHWSESALLLIAAFIMWEVLLARREKRLPSLVNVRFMMTEPDEFETVDGKRRLTKGLRVTVARMCAMGGREIESLAGRFLNSNDEIAGIQSTADRQTSWLLSRPMQDTLVRHDVDFRVLKQRPTTVYVVLPAERMRTHAAWLRLIIVTALRSLASPGGLRTLFMLDEFAQLGHMRAVEDAFGLYRGFSVQLWPVLQDLNQLRALYGDRHETFMANAGVIQSFGANDMTTAEFMSRRMGDTTVVAQGYNQGGSIGGSGSSNSNGVNYSQIRRRLMLPQDMMDMRPGAGLLWVAGSAKTIPFHAPPYWKIPNLARRARPNPYHTGQRGAA